MTKLLVIRSAATGGASASNQIINALAAAWRAHEPSLRVVVGPEARAAAVADAMAGLQDVITAAVAKAA